MRLSQIREQRVTWSAEVCGEMLTGGCNPAAYTPRFLAEIEQSQAKGESDATLLPRLLARVLTDWDLVDDDQPVPTTEEQLRDLPVALLSRVAQAIQAAMQPDPTTSATSGCIS